MANTNTNTDTVTIRVLDKEYQVHCPPDEQGALTQSAQLLDTRMRDIRKSGNVIGLERIAVMAALNLAYDLMTAESRTRSDDSSQRELKRLDRKLTKVLNDLERPSAE